MYRFEHHGVLGTLIDLRVAAETHDLAAAVNETVIAEIVRLQSTFSAFEESSELCRWRSGELVNPSEDFSPLMSDVLNWQSRSRGAFNPLTGVLSARWRESEEEGRLPTAIEMGALAAKIATPRFGIVDGVPVATGDCTELNLNAIAKGYIVDRALDAAPMSQAGWVSVNAGGDLAHRGSGFVRAGIENPLRPYDNEPPLKVIDLSNAALATSGGARRGFRIGGQWFGHVIDPRTGWPVDQISSASVVAPNAMTADVLATIAGVMPPTEAIDFLEEQEGVSGLVVDERGQTFSTRRWIDLIATGS